VSVCLCIRDALIKARKAVEVVKDLEKQVLVYTKGP
jgi:hypothetical protein